MKEEYCSCCSNHCLKENLQCNKGKNYFNSNNSSSFRTNLLEEKVIEDLRNCGHILHHNKTLNVNELLTVYSKEKLKELHRLLSKISIHEMTL